MKNKVGIIVIIVLLVVLLLAFGVGFFLLYKATTNTTNEGQANVIVQQEVAIEDITNFAVLEEPIVTNLLKGPDKKDHIIKLGFSLGINTSKKTSKEAGKLMTLLETQKSIVKDTVIGICTNRTYEELQTTDARLLLKEEILKSLQETFSTDLIVDVYIYDFFTQ